MKLIEKDFIRAEVYKEDARLYVRWLRSVTPEEFREGVEFFIKILLEEETELWILDAAKLHGIRLSDQQWILKDIVPLVQKSKLRKLARVGSADIFHYLSFEELIEKAFKQYDLQVEVAQFTTREMAEAWIRMDE